jgi:hypothetical protein
VDSTGAGNKGAAGGSGTANVVVNLGINQICYTIAVTGVDLPALAAHIHSAPAGTNGNVVVPFSPPDSAGNASGCASNLSPALLAAIAANPAGYYVNVHTPLFPAGAVRGQLSAISSAPPAATAPPGAAQTPTPLPTQTATATAVAALSAVEVHNAPRTVVGGNKAACDLQTNLQQLGAGCVIIASISGPGATVVYTLTYPDPNTAPQTFTDTADSRGHSLHIFNVAYVPPAGANHGDPSTIVQVTASATLADGTAIDAANTRFVVIR